MTEDEKMKKYISSINKIIKDGNPKYISYISKEYMSARKNNPMLALTMENMIKLEAKEKGSVYSIFLDNDEINLDSMSDISKITNTAEFIKNVDALSEQNVDFGDLTSDELIMQGMEIAEELAREIENMEISDEELENGSEESTVSEMEQKADSALAKVVSAGTVTAAVMGAISAIKNRISSAISNAKSRFSVKKEEKNEETKRKENDTQNKSEDSIFKKVNIDEKSVLRKMAEKGKVQNINKRNLEIESNPDGDNFSTGSDDDTTSNGTQEDDEPDL